MLKATDGTDGRSLSRAQVAEWVRTRFDLPTTTKFLLHLIYERAGEQEDGRWAAWPSLRTLAQEACFAEASGVRTVRQHLAVLEERGYIAREGRTRPNGSATSNRIVLLASSETAGGVPAAPPGVEAPPGPGAVAPGGPGVGAPGRKVHKEEPDGVAPTAGVCAREAGKLPEGFPSELLPHLRHAFRVLRSVAEQAPRGREVKPYALAQVIVPRGRKPLVEAAHDYAAWCEQRGYPHTDVVAGYRNWLNRCPDLAAREPMPGEARPAAPAGVTPIRRPKEDAARYRAEWFREQMRQP